MPAEKLLDARELEAPLPLEGAIKIARQLQMGEYLKMMHRMRPCKLDAILDKMGISHLYFEADDTHFVFAWLPHDTDTKKYLLNRLANEYGRTFAI